MDNELVGDGCREHSWPARSHQRGNGKPLKPVIPNAHSGIARRLPGAVRLSALRGANFSHFAEVVSDEGQSVVAPEELIVDE